MARTSRSEAGGATGKRSLSTVLAQAATVVGVLSGVVGLMFLLRPDLQPQPSSPKRSATLALLDLQPRLTRRQYMQRTHLSAAGSGLTPEQLDERGAVIEYRYAVIGYKGKELPVKHQLIDETSGDLVSEAEMYLIEPLVDEDTGAWHAFVPLPRRSGRFFVLLQLFEPEGLVPLDRIKTRTFRSAL
jgi:hypothetical protein